LPKAVRKRVTVEAGSTFGWHRWAGDEGITIGINRYGASAPGDEILRNLGMTVEHVTAAALRLMGRNEEADKEYGGETAFAATAPSAGHS
jgi:transketolase